MGYKQDYETAVQNGTVRHLTADYQNFATPGDSVTGKLLGRSPVQSKLGGQTYNQYLFDTDRGLVKCAPGRAFDSEIGPSMKEGEMYHVEFRGKAEIGDGRQVNKFNTIHFGPNVTRREAGSSQPF